MDENSKKLRLAAKTKLLSMGNRSFSNFYKLSKDYTDSICEKKDLLLTTKTSKEGISSDLVFSNIIKLISSNMPFGIPVSELTTAYNTNYSNLPALDVYQFGVANIDQLLSFLSITEAIHCHQIDGENRVFVYSKSNVRFIESIEFLDKTLCYDFRDEIVYPGEYISEYSLTSDINSVQVKVTYIKDPLNLWIRQFNNGDNRDAILNNLLEDLMFYNQIDLEKWRVPHNFLCIGLPVIAFDPCTKCWQRARIIEIHPVTVTLIFVDCGGMVTQSINNIYLMKREFFKFTAQSLHVGIYDLKHLIKEQIQWPVQLVCELIYLLYTSSEQCVRCRFAEKISDSYYYVHLFDRFNVCLDLNVLISNFITNKTFSQSKCPILNLVSRIEI